MKVLLCGINSKYIHSNLAVRYLKAYTEDLNYDCEIMEFSVNDRHERVVQEILSKLPDIVVFSCYIWNMEYVKHLSELIKLIDNNIKILYGGPEVSYDSEIALKNSVADFVIEGEGEETYRDFIESIISNKNPENIKGLHYKIKDKITCGGKREAMNLDKLIFPYTLEEDLNNKIVYYEASRGCPFKCKYCLSSVIRGVRFLNIERVKKDLKFLVDKKVRLVKFVDRTFNCSSDFAIQIWQYLMSLDTDTIFHFEISADILNDEQLKVLEKAPKGRFQFEVGVQTTNKEVLKNINRYVDFDDIKKQVIKLNSYGNIMQHLDLIAGLPGEDFHSFKKSFNDLYSIQPDEIQLGFLKILKGAPMKDEVEKWGIIYSPYSPFEVLKTNNISYNEIILLKSVEEMVDKYYNTKKFKTILKYFIPKFDTPFDFYLSLGSFFNEKGYFSRSLSAVDYYRVFVEFNQELCADSSEILLEIIKFDYLVFNKKRWIPPFLNRYEYDKSKFKADKKHIEVFKFNIFKYLDDHTVEEGNFYYCFAEEIPAYPKEIK